MFLLPRKAGWRDALATALTDFGKYTRSVSQRAGEQSLGRRYRRASSQPREQRTFSACITLCPTLYTYHESNGRKAFLCKSHGERDDQDEQGKRSSEEGQS